MPSLGDWFQGAHSRLSDAELLPIFPGLKPNHTKSHLFDYTGHETEATAQWLRWNEYRGHLTRVLLKVDRASMYHSLEVRVPLLDLEVIRVAQKIDWNSCLDIERGVGKLPLRHALKQYTTHQTMAKRGFSVPMSDWLRGPLLALFKDRIADRRSLLGLEFDSSHALSLLNTHSIGQKDMGWGLWAVLGLILWNDAHFEASPNAS
jgi:asparagine synthase (glutamine-hydrolysing)